MDTLDAIKTRRSVRRFDERKVSEDTIRDIVNSATYAPSWKNSETTRYIAVMSETLKAKVASECVMNFASNANIINSAPVLIVVTTVDRRSGFERDGSPSTSKGSHWQSFDAGIASYAFCLTAHELGLRTVIMGIFDEAKVREVVGVPEEQSVSALIALGYNDADFPAPPRKNADTLLTIK